MSSPFFSICIPNYNYSNFIGKTIESVLSQSFDDFEIIIVDNASTDNSWEVIQEYKKNDVRIKIFRNQYNIGFAPNLQRATEHATGKYLLLLSADDVMFPEALRLYNEVIIQNGSENIVLHSAFYHINSEGDKIDAVYRRKGSFHAVTVPVNMADEQETFTTEEWDSGAVIKYAIETNRGIGAFLSIVYPREVWQKVEGYNTTYQIFPDKAFLFKLLTEEVRYIYVNRALFGYRIHTQNQNSINQGQTALKHQIDGYHRTLSLPETTLNKAGVSRRTLQAAYIKHLCLGHAKTAIAAGQTKKAFKLICFGFATYPEITYRKGLTWVVLFLILLGPLGTAIAKSTKKANKTGSTS